MTLDWVILHTVVHHSLTDTYMLNFVEIDETFCGRTNVRTYVRTDGRTVETGFITSTLSKSRLNNNNNNNNNNNDNNNNT